MFVTGEEDKLLCPPRRTRDAREILAAGCALIGLDLPTLERPARRSQRRASTGVMLAYRRR
jgi:hypothetical protein